MTFTIKDIAKIANVSIATVSRVLNNEGGYNEATKKKILEIAKEIGYRKNEMARSLVKNTSNTIGVILPRAVTMFYGDIISGIEDIANERGFSVILTQSGIKSHRMTEALNLMAERRVDGLIIVSIDLSSEHISQLNALGTPTILLSTKSSSSIPYIKVDDFDASYAAVKYLLDKGHRNIGLAGADSSDTISGIPRIEGYKKALIDFGITPQNNWIKFGNFSYESGIEAMKEFMKESTELTAIFCVSDDVALGVMSVAFANNLTIPENLSVIGYDNSRVSRMSIPPLTSVSQPFYEMGKSGCERVIDAIKTDEEIQTEIVPYEIIERSSVRSI